jgi:hypothetical protein
VVVIKPALDFFSGVIFGEEGADEVPTTPAQAAKVAGGDVEKFDYKNAVKDPDAAIAAAKGSAPISQGAATKSAESLATASKSRRRVPFRHEIMNAASFVDAGVLSKEDFQQFLRTGSFSSSAELTFHNMGKGVLVATTPQGVVGSFQAPGFGEDSGDARERFDDLTTFAEDKFRDRDGKVIYGLLDRFRTEYEPAAIALGIDNVEVTPLLANRLAEALRLVDNFDPDPAQEIFRPRGGDLNMFSDPELGANNMALGATALEQGLTGDAANIYLYDYGLIYRGALPSNIDGKEFIQRVRTIEAEVDMLEQGAIAGTLTGYNKRFNGAKNRDDLRFAIIQDLIATAGK